MRVLHRILVILGKKRRLALLTCWSAFQGWVLNTVSYFFIYWTTVQEGSVAVLARLREMLYQANTATNTATERILRDIEKMEEFIWELTWEQVIFIFHQFVGRLKALGSYSPPEMSLLESYCRNIVGFIDKSQAGSLVEDLLKDYIIIIWLREDGDVDVEGVLALHEVAIQVAEILAGVVSIAV